MRLDLIQQAVENRRKIERVLASSREGLTLSEIARRTGLSPQTVKRHLMRLIAIGRVHKEDHYGFSLYYWNGEGKYQETVRLSDKHTLFIDVFVNPWGKPYIRIKETKFNPSTQKWEEMGAVIVDAKRVKELARKLINMAKHIDEYAEKR